MADDGDDDYLSDKFLTPVEPQNPKTYSEKRKEALRESFRRDEQNRTKSRRQLERESREEGLSKTLFERAEDDKSSGRGPENKALSMMLKMGFKPGQALGVPDSVDERTTPIHTSPEAEANEGRLVDPLPLNEWSGTSNLSPSLFPLPLVSTALNRVSHTAHKRYREERYRPRKAGAVAN